MSIKASKRLILNDVKLLKVFKDSNNWKVKFASIHVEKSWNYEPAKKLGANNGIAALQIQNSEFFSNTLP